MNPRTIIFIGRSGSGKGTQVKMISEELLKNSPNEILHLEAGTKFREFIGGKNLSNKLAKGIADGGGLQPEFLSIWAWTEQLVNNIEDDTVLFIDGTPRRINEAKILDAALDFYNRSEVDVVYVNVSREIAYQRMKQRGRHDDLKDSDIIARLDWFDTEVSAVLDHYRSHRTYKFHEIDGNRDVNSVHRDIFKSLF